MRLIDADSLKDYIDCGHLRPPTELCFSELDVCNMIDKRPTIDAVEVVRCKDCKWHMNDYMGEWCGKLSGHPGMKADDFCSYGEREGG